MAAANPVTIGGNVTCADFVGRDQVKVSYGFSPAEVFIPLVNRGVPQDISHVIGNREGSFHLLNQGEKWVEV